MVPFTQTRIPVKGLMAGAEEVAFGAGAATAKDISPKWGPSNLVVRPI